MICPYYGKNEDYCDVGCGYISPHDVRVIIAFCSAKYHRCPTFQSLHERFPGGVPYPADSRERGATHPYAATVAPAAIKPSPPPCKAPPEVWADPTPAWPEIVGLLALGLTMLLFNLRATGLGVTAAELLAIGIFYGGLSQVIAGLQAWRQNHVYGAITFVPLGLFWLSLVTMDLLPTGKTGVTPQASVYLSCWGLYALLLLLGSGKRPMAIRLALGTLPLALLAWAGATTAFGIKLQPMAAALGTLSGCSAVGAALVRWRHGHPAPHQPVGQAPETVRARQR